MVQDERQGQDSGGPGAVGERTVIARAGRFAQAGEIAKDKEACLVANQDATSAASPGKLRRPNKRRNERAIGSRFDQKCQCQM